MPGRLLASSLAPNGCGATSRTTQKGIQCIVAASGIPSLRPDCVSSGWEGQDPSWAGEGGGGMAGLEHGLWTDAGAVVIGRWGPSASVGPCGFPSTAWLQGPGCFPHSVPLGGRPVGLWSQGVFTACRGTCGAAEHSGQLCMCLRMGSGHCHRSLKLPFCITAIGGRRRARRWGTVVTMD